MKRVRDMSRREFNAVLKRRGWRKVLCWIEIADGTSIGMILIGGKINLRASIAYAAQRESELISAS